MTRKKRSDDPVQATLDVLAKRWPKAFTRHKPLQIGVHEAITDALVGVASPEEISAALATWVADPRYLKNSSKVGALRINLDGNPVGTVSAAQATHAQFLLSEQTLATLAARHNSGRENTK